MSESSTLVVLLGLLRMLVEVAGCFLVGQGALYVLAGAGREGNPIYRLLRFLASPAVSVLRRLLTKRIADRHVPPLTFLVLAVLWVFLAWLRLLILYGP